MQRIFTRLQQAHALLGTGDQQRAEIVIRHQLHAALNDFRFGFTFPDHGFKF